MQASYLTLTETEDKGLELELNSTLLEQISF